MLNEGDSKEMDLQKTELQRLLRSSTSESRRAGIRASLKSLDAITPRGGCDETSSADPDAAEESRESIAPLSLNKQSMTSGGWNSGGGGALSARRKSRSTIEMDAIPEHSKPGKQAAGSVAAVHSWGVGLNRNASTTDGIKDSGVGSTNQITELNTTHYIAEAYASSFDPRHPAADIFKPGTFWISTGGYPQTLRLRFRKHVELRRIAILASGVVALSVAGDATGTA